ncbi:hypothetical protein CKF46_37895, partial [Klebsiella pneumoniae]
EVCLTRRAAKKSALENNISWMQRYAAPRRVAAPAEEVCLTRRAAKKSALENNISWMQRYAAPRRVAAP